MLAINKNTANLGTIKMALFIATQEPTLKGTKTWNSCERLLDWISQFDSEDTIVITNNEKIQITKLENHENHNQRNPRISRN